MRSQALCLRCGWTLLHYRCLQTSAFQRARGEAGGCGGTQPATSRDQGREGLWSRGGWRARRARRTTQICFSPVCQSQFHFELSITVSAAARSAWPRPAPLWESRGTGRGRRPPRSPATPSCLDLGVPVINLQLVSLPDLQLQLLYPSYPS